MILGSSPGSLVASAKVCPSTRSEPRLSTSVLKKPASEPLPYWIAKSVPLPCMQSRISFVRLAQQFQAKHGYVGEISQQATTKPDGCSFIPQPLVKLVSLSCTQRKGAKNAVTHTDFLYT